jgi:hypothetical protein
VVAGVPDVEEAAHEAFRRVGHENGARLGERLEPCGDIGRVADGRVVGLEVGPERADDDRAGVDADAHREPGAATGRETVREPVHRVAHRERRAHGTLRVVPVRHGRAEDGHEAVARELIHDARKAIHRRKGRPEVSLEQLVELLGIEPFGERGRPDEVAKEHRDVAALALGPGGRRGRRRRDRGDVGGGDRHPRTPDRSGTPARARPRTARSA